ncbi:MAG: HEAT repeat domain-containing protein [Chloroflexota bacterium]|mgnify:CR=1 FL=1|nr:HEAT repeat domain-containing protein [Chloroflexota bacterium]
METTKKILAYHLSRLQHRSPEIRLASIQELAQLGDSDALEPLAESFKNDPDPDVRRAAQEAGRLIFKQRHIQK